MVAVVGVYLLLATTYLKVASFVVKPFTVDVLSHVLPELWSNRYYYTRLFICGSSYIQIQNCSKNRFTGLVSNFVHGPVVGGSLLSSVSNPCTIYDCSESYFCTFYKCQVTTIKITCKSYLG